LSEMKLPICEQSTCLADFLGRAPSGVCHAWSSNKRILAGLLSFLFIIGLARGAERPYLTQDDGAGGHVRVTHSSDRNLSLAVSLPGMSISSYRLMADNQVYSQVIVPGAGQLQVGRPDVPALAKWVLIPNGTSPSISVDPGEPQVFDNVDIPPVQPPKADFQGAPQPPFTKDAVIYSTNADYPGVFAELKPTKNVRGQDCTVVWLYPYQYNPVTRRLSVYQNLKVELDFDGDIQPVPLNLQNREFEVMERRMALNAEAVLSAQRQAKPAAYSLYTVQAQTPSQNLGDGQTGGCDYLIICDPAFEAAAETLAGWKRMSGFRTKVLTTDQTGTTAAEIESCIDASQREWFPAPSYVLLLGDAEYIPCFYELTHASDLNRQEGLMQGKVASDRYYGDTNEDGIADVFVGRLPVDTPQEAQIAVDRIIRYERTPPDPTTHPDFYTNFAVVAYFDDAQPRDGYADARYVATSEDIYQYLQAAGYNGQRIYSHDPGVQPTHWSQGYVFENDQGGGQPLPDYLLSPNFAWDGSTADISNAVNSGVFLLSYRGHGSRLMHSSDGLWYPGGWMQPEFQEHNAAALTNGGLTPVVFSTTCMTGWFDNETDDEQYEVYSGGSPVQTQQTDQNTESLCEQLILNPNGGAVGVIGATRVTYSGRNDRLVWGWMDAIWPDFIESHNGTYGDSSPIYQMGPVFEYGKRYMLTKYSYEWDYTKTTIDEFVWFGDPTMEIRTGVPVPLTGADVVYPAFVNAGYPEDVTIAVAKDGTPVPGARVTISRADAPQDYWTDLTDTSGNVSFPSLTPSQQGDYNIVVTAHNYVPYEGIIDSESVSAGAITVERQVSASQDDGYTSDESSQDLDADYLTVGSSADTAPPYCMAGMVFRNINVPPGAEIISAHLKICAYDDHLNDVVYGAIQAEAADDADAFGQFRSIGLLSRTQASVNWDIVEPWTAQTWYESPDIANVIQEVVNRSGWTTGSAVAILYSTRQRQGGYRYFCSYDRGGDYAPKLDITYAVDGTCVIRGRVTFLGDGLAGVQMEGLPDNVVTDAEGNYRAEVEYGWSGRVAPVKAGYEFSPAHKDYAGVTFEQFCDYAAAVRTYTLSGRVSASDGSGIGGAIVAANNAGGSSTTDSTGVYSLTVPHGWSGRVTPSKPGYAFTPAYRDYTGVTEDRPNQDYAAPTHTISGHVRAADGSPISGVNVLADNRVATATTDSTGYCCLALPHGWSGRVFVSKTGYIFEPEYRDYASISSDRSGQDYTAVPQNCTLSGYVYTFDGSPISGVTISANHGVTTTTTDLAGHYSLTVPYGWSGQVTPSKTGSIFDPAYRQYASVTADQVGEDYSAVQTYTISGYVWTSDGLGLSGVRLSADNGGGSGTTDSAGYYILPVPAGWSGRVTPAKAGYTFTPAYRDYPSVVRNRTMRDYSAEPTTTP
jgi:Peptidase family C25/Propeptide_C25